MADLGMYTLALVVPVEETGFTEAIIKEVTSRRIR